MLRTYAILLERYFIGIHKFYLNLNVAKINKQIMKKTSIFVLHSTANDEIVIIIVQLVTNSVSSSSAKMATSKRGNLYVHNWLFF